MVHTYQITLIVAASIAIAVAVTMTFLSIFKSSDVDNISLVLSVAGIGIGLLIFLIQNKQSHKLDEQSTRIEKQRKEIGNIVGQVNIQTKEVSKMLEEVRTSNAEVRKMVAEVRWREDRAKRYHLHHVIEHVKYIKKVVIEQAAIIKEKYVDSSSGPTDEDHQRISKNIKNRISNLNETFRTAIRNYFEQIMYLVNNPDLAPRVDVNLLINLNHWLCLLVLLARYLINII